MTGEEVARVGRERLCDWKMRLFLRHATPEVLVALGHDHNAGEWSVLTPEEGFVEADLPAVLRNLADLIEARLADAAAGGGDGGAAAGGA